MIYFNQNLELKGPKVKNDEQIKEKTKTDTQAEVALEIASDQTVPDKWDL